MNKISTPRCATRLMVSILSYLRNKNWTTLFPSKSYALSFLFLLFLFPFNKLLAQAYCTMICNDAINVSVGIDCEVTVLYDMLLEDGDNPRLCSPNGRQAYKIAVFDEQDNQLPTSPIIPFEQVGQTLRARAKHWATGNSCWTTLKIVDKVFPRLECPPDISISCTSSTLPEKTYYPTALDCAAVEFSYTDSSVDFNCGDPLGAIERRWTVEDASGNRDFCTQTISIAQSSMDEIVFPHNLDDLELPSLECEWVAVDPASLLPENTGRPQLNGQAITKDGPCRLIPSYTDDFVESCEGTYKVLRTWKIVNWCTSEVIEAIQIIKVIDTYGPVISVPDDITISTESTSCEAILNIPPAEVTDACSGAIRVTVQSSYGSLSSNGGILQNVPVGKHLITYAAEDACGNISSKDVYIHVIDDDAPNVICQDQTVISLTGDGFASATTQSFDNGTFDNCCLDGMGIRRMDKDSTTFGTTVSFSCEDIGTIILIELQAIDCYGNTNACMAEVSIQDKVAPAIQCPADITLDCDIDPSDLNEYGIALAEDNCGYELSYEQAEELDNCGRGLIKRTWTAIDKNERTNTCTQTLTLQNNTPWNIDGQGIIWPEDFETSECITETSLLPEELPTANSKPQTLGTNACALIATNYEDLRLDIEEPACYKILRKWSLVDWCNFDANNPEDGGVYEHTQIIKVLDNTNPVFDSIPADFTVAVSGTNCSASVLLPMVTASDCSKEVSLTASGDLGNGFGPYNDVQPGNYQMTYTAADGCGNTTSKKITITVTDDQNPTPVCASGLAITMMPGTDTTDPSVELWAVDLNQKSFDNCTLEENLHYTIRLYNPDENSVPTSENIIFTCDHLGVQAVEVWVADEQGNADFCITSVIIQDNMEACNTQLSGGGQPGTGEGGNAETMVAVAGKILTASGERLKNVKVTITHKETATYQTEDDGAFYFENIPTKDGYEITPSRNDEPLNGVSTYDVLLIRRHILNIDPFDSPYQMIAADVNRSGSITTFDLVELQKLILGIYKEFPNNTAWRFVVGDYEFDSITTALSEDFPESYLVQNPEKDLMDLSFMAVKIGDVNNSMSPSLLSTTSSRSRIEPVTLEIQDQSFKKGAVVEVAIQSTEAISTAGFQFALQFDEEVLTYHDWKGNNNLDLINNNFGTTSIAKGFLTTSWHDPIGKKINKKETLFTVKFIAKKEGTLKGLVTLDNRLSPELYTPQDAIHPIELRLGNNNTSTTVELYQNQPNPFRASTDIRFYLPQQEAIQLTIYNALGSAIKVWQGTYSEGTHTIPVAQDIFSQAGVYYYTLEVAGEKWNKKMLLLH